MVREGQIPFLDQIPTGGLRPYRIDKTGIIGLRQYRIDAR